MFRRVVRVLFFVPRLKISNPTSPMPLGVLSIASYIKNSTDHEVRIVDRNLTFSDVNKEVSGFAPDIIGVSVISAVALSDAEYVSGIGKQAGKTVVWGGHFATACAEMILRKGYADIISLGNGESTWRLLLEAYASGMGPDDVPGIMFRRDGAISKNPEASDFPESELLRLDFDLIRVPDYYSGYYDNIASRMIWLFAKRGCVGQCTFCCNKSFHHQRIVKKSYDVVCDEIRELVTKYHVDGIYFGDELWCVSGKEMRYQCDMLDGLGLDFVWGCSLRTDILNKEDYDYMFEHGCRWIYFGVESGDPERLKTIKKGVDIAKVEQNVRDCYDAGILPTVSFILGFPDETVEELRRTAALMRRLSFFADLEVYYYTPVVGSEMYQQLVSRNRFFFDDDLDAFKTITWDHLNAKFLSQYSSIPFRDLKVILSCAVMWTTFNRDKSVPLAERKLNHAEGTQQSFAAKFFSKLFGVISYSVKNRILTDPVLFWLILKSYVFRYASALFYSVFFVRTKKKYQIRLFGKKSRS